MTFTVKASAPGAIYSTRSATTYTANAGGFITSVPAGNDLEDLISNGCVFVSSSGLPWVAGRFYGIPNGSTQAAFTTVSGTIYAYPVSIPNPVSLASINVSVTTGHTGGKARGALFYDVGGYPGAIVPGTDTGDLDGTGTAVVTKTFGTAITMAPGRYWYGSIYTASSTMPDVIGATAIYGTDLNSTIGSDTAAHALATSAEAATGILKTGQTYPAVDMTTSFPVFPTGGTVALNVTTPIASFGV